MAASGAEAPQLGMEVKPAICCTSLMPFWGLFASTLARGTSEPSPSLTAELLLSQALHRGVSPAPSLSVAPRQGPKEVKA